MTDEQIINHPIDVIRKESNDTVHFNLRGAQKLTKWIAKDIYNSEYSGLKALAENINPNTLNPSVFVLGDSLANTYDALWAPQQGWGAYIGNYFDTANVVNFSKAGASTNSYYNELDCFRALQNELRGDDYMLISLGMNDMLFSGKSDTVLGGYAQSPVKIGTTVEEYKANLKNFIAYAKSVLVKPVLVTPADFGGKYNNASEYIEAMKSVGVEENVPVIDLRSENLKYIDSVENGLSNGDVISEAVLSKMYMTKAALKDDFGLTDEFISAHPNNSINTGIGDTTSFNINGAKMAAKWVAELIMNSDYELSEHIFENEFNKIDEDVAIASAEANSTSTGVVVSGAVTKNEWKKVSNVLVAAIAYNGKTFVKSGVDAVTLDENGTANFECEINGTLPLGSSYKLYAWDANTFKPLMLPKEMQNINFHVESKANGVVVSWDAVDGASDYTIYRDGIKLASLRDTAYTDKYFSTIEQLEENKAAYDADHSYSITTGNLVSGTVLESADTSLIKYITFDGLGTGKITKTDVINANAHGIKLNPMVGTSPAIEQSTPYYFVSGTMKLFTSFYGTSAANNSYYVDGEEGLRLISVARDLKLDLVNSAVAAGNGLSAETPIEGATISDTEPFAVVDSFGDTSLSEYSVMLSANMKTPNKSRIFTILTNVPVNEGNNETDSSYNSCAGFVYGSDMTIKSYTTDGKPVGTILNPGDGGFKVPSQYLNDYYTYVFDIKACISDKMANNFVKSIWMSASKVYDSKYDANFRFLGDNATGETAAVKSFGLIKAADFIK